MSAFVDVIEYPSEEKLTQFKSAKEELSGFRIRVKRIYQKTGADKVWIASGQSGLEKRHCTVQLPIFADGNALPPLLIFRGKGLRIGKAMGSKIKVIFQPKTSCDEAVMKKWLKSTGIGSSTTHQLWIPRQNSLSRRA